MTNEINIKKYNTSPLFCQTITRDTRQTRSLGLLHGFGLNSRVWSGITPALSQEYNLYCVDLPGHGYSPAPDQPLGLPEMAEAVCQSVPYQDTPTWIGWSLGGVVALWMAYRWPDRVKRLILIASTPQFAQTADWSCGMETAVLDRFAFELSQDYATTLKRFLALQVQGEGDKDLAKETLRHLRQVILEAPAPHPLGLQSGLAILQNASLLSILTNIPCPILWIFGERDKLVPVEVGERLKERSLISPQNVRIIAKAGHAPFVSHRLLCLEIIKTWLRETHPGEGVVW